MHFEELEALDPRNPTLTRIEMPTPHKVSVLILVKQYIKAKKAATDSGILYPTQYRRNFCMLLLKLIQYPDMTYNDLYQLLCSPKFKIDPLHLERFEKVMGDLFSLGIETLFDFAEMDNIENMLAEQLGVSQFSLVGLYIRRVGVILERLSFPEMMALHKNICLYYEKGVRSLTIGPRKPHCVPSSSEATANITDEEHTMEESVLDTDTVHQDRNPHSKWSPKQAQLFVNQQCNLLEKNELRALSPIEMQTKLNEIIQDNPLNAKAYFLGYMNQLRLRDVFGALDALHRSFDRSPTHMMGQNDQKGFQYFSVNLAILHASFNHKKEALNALKECMMLAQECGDKRCLDLANSWYCLLNSSRIGPFEKSLPDIQDPGLIQSLSLAIEFVVAFGAKCGFLPLDLFELLLKSDELNNKNTLLEHISDSLALRTTLWVLYGRYEMSALYSQLLLNLKKTWVFGDVSNSESVSKVLANLSLWFNTQGEHQLSAVLQHHARTRFPRYPFAADWMTSECHIAIQQCIYRGRWQEALRWCCQLYLLDKHDGNIQRAAVYIAKSYNNAARRILQNLLQENDLDTLRQVRVLMLLAYNSLSDKCISSETIDLLMQASVIAEGAYLQYEHAMIDTILAQVLLQMGLHQKALQALRNSIDTIYTNGGIYDRAKTDFIFTRCLVAAGRDREQQHKRLLKSLPVLERAIEAFRKLEAHAKVLDVFAYISKTFNAFGFVAERNKYACKFKQYYTDNPVPREYLGMAY
ncbi:anaphase-promoting complex subunit 5 isoform X1 [Stomoxys calcitrans]|uniref:anaphase-promoting complex subunit 5 isoform X1 n=1 Tax=Stomoxys calcitrans TaxID=35570 RepID=UPI0027E29075|nr:anaphase-promoting complex subunit 5 isoform X1 [Stomoxys calcitrans]